MLQKFLITYLLSFATIFFGKVFVFTLGDQHALGHSPSYYAALAAYYIFGMLIVILTFRFIFRHKQSKSSKEFVLDIAIYVVLVAFGYATADLFITKYVAHLV